MSISVDIEENAAVRVTDQAIDANPPDEVAFTADGVLRPTEGLLGEFEGSALRPVEVAFSVEESRTVEIDLEAASLRLDAVDVGVETPDSDDLPTAETRPSTDDLADLADLSDSRPGAIAFTVEGVISGVPDETLARLTDGSTRLASITFAVQERARSDGGSADDVLLEFTLLGFGIVVRRDGTIEVSMRSGGADVGLP